MKPKPAASINLTETQKKGVETVDRDVCVTAGAGSGKTRVLVERFVNLVSNKNIPIQNILTITFTEKAASEMKERVAKRFEDMGLWQELQDIEFAYLSTIDSFSARLLREHALEAGVDPEFTVLDEYESWHLQRNVAEVLTLEWESNNPQGMNVLLRGLHCQDVEEAAINIISKVRSTGIALEDLPRTDIQPEDIVGAADKISACLDGLETYLKQGALSEKSSANVSTVVSALSPVMHLARDAPDELTADHIESMDETIKRHAKLTVPEPLKSELKALREELFPKLRGLFFERVSAGVGEVLREFLAELARKYAEEKRLRSALDFSDLAEKTICLLKSASHVRQQLRDRFKYILVDEFQDTNKLQKTLVDLLRSENNLFVVGDTRQSIYGFRDADIDVFLNHSEEVAEKNGAVIRLDENFRTRPEIIEFINHVFRNVPGGSGRAESTELIAASHFRQKRSPSVELILARGANMDEARGLEAAALARRIHDIVEKKEVKLTRLGGPGAVSMEGSPVSYGDIAILLRTTTDIKLYERALAELNIPFFVIRGRGLYNTREIMDLVNFLKVIDNPLDEIALAAVLRSPFVGVSDESLFWLAHYSKDRSNDSDGSGKNIFNALAYLDKIPEIEPQYRERLLGFMEQLGKFRDLRERLPVSALMDTVIEETNFDTRMLALPSGRQKHANIRKVVELTGGLEKKGFSGLSEFFGVISDLRLRETRESEAQTDVEKSDVVKLMTVHSAKGLEFPVVGVADLSRGRRNRADSVVFSKKTGLGFKALNPSTKVPERTLSYCEIAESQDKNDLEEAKRVLYVALTRAEEHLLLSGALSQRSKGGEWMKMLAEKLDLPLESPESGEIPESVPFGDNGRKLRVITEVAQNKTRRSFKRLSAADREKILGGKRLGVSAEYAPTTGSVLSLTDIPEAAKGRGDGGNYVYSVTEIMSFLLCPRLYYLRYKQGLPALHAAVGGESSFEVREDDEPGKDVLGSIAHMALERYRPGSGESQLRQSVLYAFSQALIAEPTREQIGRVTNWVTDFYAGRIGRMVQDSKRVERELSFVFNYGGSPGGNPIRGTIDLLFSPDGSEWRLVDYKASSAVPKEVGGYQFQLRLYSLAVEAIYGQRPSEATLSFIASNETVPVDMSDSAMQDLRDKLDSFFRGQDADTFPERKGQHCDWCEYSGYCNER
ncbi:MAG: UvrD-helicase domain-containing protein [Planctomycetota bacterium]|jgi:ATP-dependent helicase/nuclease subunit A